MLRFAARAAMHEIGNPLSGRNVPSRTRCGIDPMAALRAAQASAAVHAYYDGLINAITQDKSLTPEQRKAAIAALRAKAKAEAKAASQRVMEAAKAQRQVQCG